MITDYEFPTEEFDLPAEFESDEEQTRFRRLPTRSFSPRPIATRVNAARFNAARANVFQSRPQPKPQRWPKYPPPVVGRRIYLYAPESPIASEYVRWVQAMLNQALNLQLPVDGIISVETRSAIRSFQEKNSLPVTGIVGPDTERALIALRDGQSPAGGATKSTEPAAAPAEPGVTAPAEPAPTAPAAEFNFEWNNFAEEYEHVLRDMESESPTPVPQLRATFRLECPAGCAPFPANQCHTILRRAVLDAIALANNAASKLTAAKRDDETIRLFRFIFGHDPSRPVPWANNQQSGVIVAKRFLACARELGGGRRTLYRCGCAGCDAKTNAITLGVTEVCLCPKFWGPSPQHGLSARCFRAGIILHEMLHQLFIEFLLHDPNERRRNNAHCYEAFAMRLAGQAADQADVTQCRERPT